MDDGIVRAVLCGTATHYDADGVGGNLDCPWFTAYRKRPVEGPVRVQRDGLAGDEHADTLRHGGAEKAVLAYAAEHYPRWQRELAIAELPAGAFGENLLVDGLSEATVCLGDSLRCGSVLLRAVQPRQPGWKVARRWQRIRLPKRVGATRSTGWYLEVVEEGELQAGDRISLVQRPHPEWTIRRAIEILYAADRDPAPARELMACPALGESWKSKLRKRFNLDR